MTKEEAWDNLNNVITIWNIAASALGTQMDIATAARRKKALHDAALTYAEAHGWASPEQGKDMQTRLPESVKALIAVLPQLMSPDTEHTELDYDSVADYERAERYLRASKRAHEILEKYF